MSEEQAAPSQISGQIKSVQGTVYQAVGAVLPTSLGGEEWAASGAALAQEGQKEVDAAKAAAAVDATVDATTAKAKSAWGYVTGDQDKQTEGNLENESAQWRFKQATSDGVAAIPVPSVEGVKGKVESVVGIVTGDQEKQQEGNLKAEKAAWTDGV